MYRISPFTPIFFTPSSDKYGPGSVCAQTFANTDRILIEVIAVDETVELPDLVIRNLCDGSARTYQWSVWVMNSSTTIYFIELHSMEDGVYQACIVDDESEPFVVTSKEDILKDTVLLQYSNTDNRQRNDVVFWIDGMQHFFSFRVPGGFKDDNWSFIVENEQFLTSGNDRIDLYSQDSTIKSLTIGSSDGCPVWFADLVNRLLCCNYVYVDNERYVRNESEVPELSAEVEGLKSYIFKIGLRKVLGEEPTLVNKNRITMRTVERNGTLLFRETAIGSEEYNLII